MKIRRQCYYESKMSMSMAKKKRPSTHRESLRCWKGWMKIRVKRDLNGMVRFVWLSVLFFYCGANTGGLNEQYLKQCRTLIQYHKMNEWMKETIKYFHNSFRAIFIYQLHSFTFQDFLLFHVPDPLYCCIIILPFVCSTLDFDMGYGELYNVHCVHCRSFMGILCPQHTQFDFGGYHVMSMERRRQQQQQP